MNRTRLAQVLLAVSVVCLASSLGRAQGGRVFIMAGGSFLEDERFFTCNVTNVACSNDRFRSNYASGGKITLGGEYSLSKVLGLEGSYAYGRNNLRLSNLTASQTLGYGVRTQRFSANAVAHSPISFLGVRPYLTAGLEYDHLGPTSQAKTLAFTQGFAGPTATLGSNNKVGVNYGGGADWSFFPTLSLRLDLRDHITGTPTYGLSSGRYPVSGAAHDVELSAGIVFHIGK